MWVLAELAKLLRISATESLRSLALSTEEGIGASVAATVAFLCVRLDEDVDNIRLDVIEQALIMGDQNNRIILPAQFIDPFGNDLHGVDIKA